jgi:hypothetical protein
MTTYEVYFIHDAGTATHEFEAKTPEQALTLAREFYADPDSELHFEECDELTVNEIAVVGDASKKIAVWRSDELCLRLAGEDLLRALEQAVAALNHAPRFAVPSLETDSYRIAAICDLAIAKAKGGAA